VSSKIWDERDFVVTNGEQSFSIQAITKSSAFVTITFYFRGKYTVCTNFPTIKKTVVDVVVECIAIILSFIKNQQAVAYN
jgi:hypothetical protein